MVVEKSFKFWLAQEVEESFGIRRIKNMPALQRWLEHEVSVPKPAKATAEFLRAQLEDNVDNWNEATLKFLFIGPLCALVNFNTEYTNGFSEKPLSIKTDEHRASDYVDFMVATGTQSPRAPFYLVHEYKHENKAILDPKGQLLIAMVAAQKANQTVDLTQPVYGSYVLGRFWFFVVLNGNEYAISKAFDATQKDGFATVLHCLYAMRHYIKELHEKLG